MRRIFYCLLAGIILSGASMATEFKKASDCVVGQRVINRDNQAGVIVSADGSSCRVKLDATGKIDYNIFWMLRPEGKAGKAVAPGKLAAGLYECYMLAGTQLNYMFIDIRIDGAGGYADKSGARGSYKMLDSGKISFTGPLAKANGKLMPGGDIGLNMDGSTLYNTTCSKGK